MFKNEYLEFYLSIFKGLSPADLIDVVRLTKIKRLEEGEIYIDVNSPSGKLAYIKEGLVRVYRLKDNGEDVTLMLRWENQFVASFDSVLFKRPSRFVYQALEKTVLYEIDYNLLEPIIEKNLKLSALRNSFVLNMLGEAMERMETFVALTPIERYTKLVNENPNIVNRAHDKHLATLMGITPVSLSRIRKRIANYKH